MEPNDRAKCVTKLCIDYSADSNSSVTIHTSSNQVVAATQHSFTPNVKKHKQQAKLIDKTVNVQ